MAQEIETHYPVERCPERSGERHRVFNGQQPLRHIRLQNPDNRLQFLLSTIFSLPITENESVMASIFDSIVALLEHLFSMVE
jgi:hypothetical protein